MKTARLLLVEDNRDNREVLTVSLSEKYDVASCGSAAEALAALDAISADLLILDIGMKPVDGLQCLNAIRARPGYSTTPAIALTGYARDVDRQAFLAAGFDAVVTKPVLDYPGFETLIETLLRPAGASQAPRPDTPPSTSRSNGALVNHAS
jgi:CheY-like chemotaxis protein